MPGHFQRRREPTVHDWELGIMAKTCRTRPEDCDFPRSLVCLDVSGIPRQKPGRSGPATRSKLCASEAWPVNNSALEEGCAG